MTVPSAINKSGPYIGNGVTDVFDYDFRIVDETHVRVILTDTVGAETTLVLNSDYTVSGVGAPGGGQVTLSIAPATGELLTLIRNVPFVQETDLENQGPYFAETVEDALDLAAMRDQQLQEQVDRAVKIPASADPEELDQLIEDVIRLQGSADNIDTVAGSIANVNTVGNNIADVNTVAGNIGNVGVVAGISGNVTIVAQNIDDVNTVAGDTAEINALAPISADISAVSGVAASVPTVAGIASDVEIVADNVADVTNFASVYLGARATDPTTRTDGSPLQVGDLYFDTTGKVMNVWEGVAWVPAATSSLGGLLTGFGTFGVLPDGEVPVGKFTTLFVWVNGVLLREGEDYTQDGTSFTVTNPVEGDEWQYWAYQANDATDYYTKIETDVLLADRSAAVADFVTVAGMLADNNQRIGYEGSGARVIVAPGQIVTAQGFRYEVAASDAASYDLQTAGLVRLRVLQGGANRQNVRAYAAVSTGSQDNTQSINYALQDGNRDIVIPRGTWRVDGMIEVKGGRSLLLESGATLRKYAASADNETDPIVWIHGQDAVVKGVSSMRSSLWSEVRSPYGICRLGHEDITVSPENVSFCEFSDVGLYGAQQYGQTSGLPDKGLYMAGAQLGGFVNYHSFIQGLYIRNVNVGVHLHGWANGHIFRDIIGYYIGNPGIPGEFNGAFFVSEGALDNIVKGLSFHNSPNSTGLVIANLDRTSEGAFFYESIDNTFSGLVFEQGGSSARAVVTFGGRNNYIQVIDNVAQNPQLHASFEADGNTLITKRGAYRAWTIGGAQQRHYRGTGTQTIKVAMLRKLTGGENYNGVVKLLFQGTQANNAFREVAEYMVPITSSGASAYGMGTPVKIAGDTLTITQTGSDAESVTFTVAGGSTSQRVSILATGTAYDGLTFL